VDLVVPRVLAAAPMSLLPQAVLQLAIHERRVLCATLHVDVSNTPALGLYKKAGFVEVRTLAPAMPAQRYAAAAQTPKVTCGVMLVQDGTIEDYYGQGRHAHKLIVDLHESAPMRAFLEGL
jgi:hypothetical protein